MKKEEQQNSKHLPGFYIALCCCVLAIGIAGYFTEKATVSENEKQLISENVPQKAQDDTNDDYVAVNNAVFNVEEENIVPIDDTLKNEPVVENLPVSDSMPDVIEPVEETALIFSKPSFSKPHNGEIIETFSTTLSYNSALSDWRTHNGIDIAAEQGSSVCSIADGTIKEISSDEMGKYISIEHDKGFISKYRSLGSVESLNEGDAVNSGDVIGIVGKSSGENASQTHLHLELYKDGQLVNPSEYLE